MAETFLHCLLIVMTSVSLPKFFTPGQPLKQRQCCINKIVKRQYNRSRPESVTRQVQKKPTQQNPNGTLPTSPKNTWLGTSSTRENQQQRPRAQGPDIGRVVANQLFLLEVLYPTPILSVSTLAIPSIPSIKLNRLINQTHSIAVRVLSSQRVPNLET